MNCCLQCQYKTSIYDLKLLCCCVRLVESARPNKAFASAMLASIASVRGAPNREEILSEIARVNPNKDSNKNDAKELAPPCFTAHF